MNRTVLIGCAIVVAAIAIGAAIILIGIGQSRLRQLGPEHPGATVSTPPLPPDEPTRVTPVPHPWPPFAPAAPAQPVGRHRQDTIERVSPGWMPPTAAERRRGLEQTRIIPSFQSVPRKAGGA
ncbi:hypothetical protein Ait01nite_030500 [Actinoplanes italicus]|uniref:Uncharacterized protein n=1 Tax=Actinoplanes italicus TaxID=113567 RepID=A0A2T0KJ08_9ACTN|nr:hypothetical protein [Actinoplanes italicus]PRX23509.1 hypothetical protein CLV67_103257 [Actinoplanes italicus]GIE30005.1 hypothetical protein Ait01nite_030500 [Actinoplanes italicus]